MNVDGPSNNTRAKARESSPAATYGSEEEWDLLTPKKANKHKARSEKRTGRTPSGQPLSASVGDIRNFFAHEDKNLNVSKQSPLNTNQSTINNISVSQGERKKRIQLNAQPKRQSTRENQNSFTQVLSDPNTGVQEGQTCQLQSALQQESHNTNSPSTCQLRLISTYVTLFLH